MGKLILCLSAGLIMAISNQNVAATGNTNAITLENATVGKTVSIDNYIKNVYNSIDFGTGKKISYDAFEKGYHGYLNLSNECRLNSNKQLLSICDFSLSSTQQRLWVIDLNTRKVLINDYVAHGQGSGMEYATQFSNRANSHQSSLGFYVTESTYIGKHGTSLRLIGMDKGYNSAAYERAVVIHGSDYVSSGYAAAQGRLGRSWGCPAVSNQLAGKLINTIKDGTALFIYYPSKEYLASAYWLNKKINDLPANNIEEQFLKSAHTVDSSQLKTTYKL